MRRLSGAQKELSNMVHENPDGTVTFQVYLADAESVHVTGSFNEWSRTACPMTRQADGTWSVTIRICEGEHTFQYLADGHRYSADFAAHGIELNAFGLWSSLLRIRAPRCGIKPVVRSLEPAGSRQRAGAA